MRLALVALLALPSAAFAQSVNPTGMTIPSFQTSALVATNTPDPAVDKATHPLFIPGTPAFTLLTATPAAAQKN